MMEIDKTDPNFIIWVLKQSGFTLSEYKEFISHKSLNKTYQFDNFQLSDSLTIIHKDSYNSLSFKNCQFKHVQIEHTAVNEILFENCSIEYLLIGSSKFNILQIAGLSDRRKKKAKISIAELKSLSGKIEISTDILELRVKDTADDLSIKIDARIEVLNSTSNNVTPNINLKGFIEKCVLYKGRFPFRGPFFVGNLEAKEVSIGTISGCARNLDFLDCTKMPISFDKVFCLENLSVTAGDITEIKDKKQHLNFINCYVGGTLAIKNFSVELFFVKERRDIYGAKYNRIYIENNEGSIEFESPVEFKHVINELSFKTVRIKSSSQFKLTGIKTSGLKFNDFINESNGIFTDIDFGSWIPLTDSLKELNILFGAETVLDQPARSAEKNNTLKPLLSLIKSDLGKMNFINVNLSSFEMEFHSSKFADIYLTGSELPKTVSSLSSTENPKQKFHQEKIAYTQLKKLYEQQGDSINANAYFASEMNSYYEFLGLKDNRWEVWNLWLNRFSSNHGQSIGRAFGSTLGIGILFYVGFCLSMGFRIDWDFSEESLGTLWVLFTYFFDYLNPIHRLENFEGLRTDRVIPPFARLVDGLSRIFLGYFIYQFIQAFRKHGKSK